MPTGVYPDFYSTEDDYKVWTNTITVTYIPPGQVTGITVTNVLWTAINKGDLPGDSILLNFDRSFRMARVMMSGIVPVAKGIIVDDQGVRWMIAEKPPGASVDILSFGNEFRCHCIKSMKQNSSVST